MDSEDYNEDKPKHESRRVSKPLMEKRRRARINQSLSDLKALLLEAIKSENPRHSKLEKADILEMTVRHLEELHRQQRTATLVNDPQLKNKFLVGFEECVREVELFMKKQDGILEDTRRCLLQHLTKQIKDLKSTENEEYQPSSHLLHSHKPVIQHCNASCCELTESCCHTKKMPDSTVTSKDHDALLSCNSHNYDNCTVDITEFRLVPKRLANGDLALVLPQKIANGVSGLDRSSCTASAFQLIHRDAESSSLPQEISSTNPSLTDSHSPVFAATHKHFNSESSSEASDMSSDESVGRPREPQLFRLSHSMIHSLEDFSNNQSPLSDNVWRPW
ncbi:protein hairy-like [Limulus polyphemus]|uniref:Protein hairy-like n=1 Tax=Limulus polyphemus TaxID=6850 RepID=A0ABM1BDQ8_LIMPO|nr:protein hairy-like [Limulus polyphemus]